MPIKMIREITPPALPRVRRMYIIDAVKALEELDKYTVEALDSETDIEILVISGEQVQVCVRTFGEDSDFTTDVLSFEPAGPGDPSLQDFRQVLMRTVRFGESHPETFFSTIVQDAAEDIAAAAAAKCDDEGDDSP